MNQKIVIFLFILLLPISLFAQEDLPMGTELLTNNYFDDGLNNWELYSLENSRADYELDTTGVITGKNSVHVTLHNTYGNNPSGRIRLDQHNISGGLKEGTSYYVSFNIKSSEDISHCFWTLYREPYNKNEFAAYDWVKVNKNQVTFLEYKFEASSTDPSVFFAVDFAAIKKSNVEIWIDDIHLIEMPLPITEPTLPRNGIELVKNNYFNDGINNWELKTNNPNDASSYLDFRNVLVKSENSIRIKVNNTTDNNSQQIQFQQNNLLASLKVERDYYVQFIAKANKSISNLYFTINQQEAPHNNLYRKEFSLISDEITVIMDTIISMNSSQKISISFDLGMVSEDSVYIWLDAIHLMELGEEVENIFPPETVWQPISPETIPRPEYLKVVRDPKYGVDYTCISDPTVFGVPSGSGALLSHYPKDQAWNADMSKIILGGNYLVNAGDYTFDKVLNFSGIDTRWSNTDPKIRYFCSGDKFKKINIETEEVTLLHTFPGYRATVGPWEGNISADDKYVVVTSESGGVAVKASLYDIELDSVISTKSFSGDIDWVTVPPSGDYIVVNNRGDGKIEVYDLNFNLLRVVGVDSQHGDFGVDSEGNEVWIQVIPLSMSRLSDGKYTRLLEPNIGGHISGRGFNNPGWALVSTDINSKFKYATQLFEIKLDGSGTIRHFGYARSSCTTYSNYPMGSVRQDGKKVIFNSDWDIFGSGGNALAYISEFVTRPTDVNESESNNVQMDFLLEQNYPNPFNPTTIIDFKLKVEGMTKLVVYNILGQEVKVLLNENMRAGLYSVPFNGSNLPSGIYFYKLESNNQMQVKKMLLIK